MLERELFVFFFFFFHLPSSTCRRISWVLVSIISYCLITLSKLQTHSLNARGLCPVLFFLPTLWSLEMLHWCGSTLALQTSCCTVCCQLFSPPLPALWREANGVTSGFKPSHFAASQKTFAAVVVAPFAFFASPPLAAPRLHISFYLWIIGFLWQPDSISPPGNWAEPWMHSCVVAVELIFASYVCILLRVCVREKLPKPCKSLACPWL